MTPLGSNLKEASSPGSHHLGLLSEKKFWSRAKVENSVSVRQACVFYVAPQQIEGFASGDSTVRETLGHIPGADGTDTPGRGAALERGGTGRGATTHEPVNERYRE
jgi:hypothetical protein